MKVLVVGGVAGGAAFAARLRRLDEQAEIIVFERGRYVSFANCGLPYYAGDVIKDRSALILACPEYFKSRFNIDVRVLNEVVSIERDAKRVLVREVETSHEYFETYDKLLLSPGAEPILPPFEGSDLYCVHTVRTVPDIDRIKDKLDSGKIKKAVVIGGGFIGLEMAENLQDRGIETSLIEMQDQVMPPFDKDMAVILKRQIQQHGIKLYLNEEVVKITSNDKPAVFTRSGKKIPTNMVIMAIGVHPEITLAKDANLELFKRTIDVNNKMQTSDPNIYAVGDAVSVDNPVTGEKWNVPLAWPAAKEAVVAANNICGIEDSYDGTIGTSIVKVFDLTAAMTGASEKVLIAINKKYKKIYTHPVSHASYYPGATMMSMKVLYEPETGKILGAQVVGQDGVDKRVNVLAVAVKHGLTVADMSSEEFCYAPPYGSGKDAVNLMGMAALNSMRGLSELMHWNEVTDKDFLLDVRTVAEFNQRTVKGSVNIPVDSLRERLDEIPKDKPIVVFCRVGVRGHLATRILVQNGFNARNISGGILTFVNFNSQ